MKIMRFFHKLRHCGSLRCLSALPAGVLQGALATTLTTCSTLKFLKRYDVTDAYTCFVACSSFGQDSI